MAEIERKINDNEYDIDESNSDKSMPVIKDKEDIFFATEIETNYIEKPVVRETNTTLENIQLREDHSRLTEANNFKKA